ncbi:MAG: glycerophosphodiester phosphodiesterase [Verrucomicrobia bacterium]|nr:glycerophosphodiester phosphodiesterase [Verrucomicrobiota bacterium]
MKMRTNLLSALSLGVAASNFLAVAGEKIIIAHRGASGYLPEHTLEAVAMAHAMDADYIEQDIVLTKDGVPVVLHDIHLDTVSDAAKRFPDRKRNDGRFYAIDFTLSEIRQLRVTERFDPKTGQPVYESRFPMWRSSFEIPTFEEELQLIQGLNQSTGKETGIYPEIKAPAWHRQQGQDITRIVLELLARYGYRTKSDKIYLQCFDFEELKRIRNQLGYRGKLVQLIGEKNSAESPTDYNWLRTREGLSAIAKVADGIGPALPQVVTGKVNAEFRFTDLVQHAHKLKLEVHPYTFRADALPEYVLSLEELFHLFFLKAGVDGVFTDQSDQGVAFLRSLGQSD